ncbi:hypothetical protein pb186bvf_019099 [Paramecium bursaria]
MNMKQIIFKLQARGNDNDRYPRFNGIFTYASFGTQLGTYIWEPKQLSEYKLVKGQITEELGIYEAIGQVQDGIEDRLQTNKQGFPSLVYKSNLLPKLMLIKEIEPQFYLDIQIGFVFTMDFVDTPKKQNKPIFYVKCQDSQDVVNFESLFAPQFFVYVGMQF